MVAARRAAFGDVWHGTLWQDRGVADDNDRTARLERLATAYGVATTVAGLDGESHTVSEATIVAVLGALGVAATTPEQVNLAIADAEAEEWRSVLPLSTVARHGTQAEVAVHVTDGDDVVASVHCEGGRVVELAQADVWVDPRQVGSRTVGRATFTIPADVPTGYHSIVVTSGGAEASAVLIVVPDRLIIPETATSLRALSVDTLSLRSQSSWGSGDLGDLVDVAWTVARDEDTDLVVTDPLQPVDLRSATTTLSTRWVDPLYLRIEDIRETAYLSSADRSLVEWSAEEVRDSGENAGPADIRAVRAAKRAALEVVSQVPRSPARQARYDEFVTRGGQALDDFATWSALVEDTDDLDLPLVLADSKASGVAGAREQLAERIELHRWTQWVADEQRADAHRRAREAGSVHGLATTLVASASLDGPDAWSWSGLIARGVGVGLAPSVDAPDGRVLHETAWSPRELARHGFAPFRDAVRDCVRHGGALVIDDAVALFRSWWIPGGARASAGTYLEHDHEALIGILCLEAERAGVLVIADDSRLTGFADREALTSRGILGVDDLRRGPFRAVRPGSVARVTGRADTPLSAWLAGEDMDLLESLNILDDVETARRVRRSERDQVLARAIKAGITATDSAEREQVEGLYAWAAQSGAAMVMVRLADAVGDRRTPQVAAAGTSYPSGRLPLVDANGSLVRVEHLPNNARLRTLLERISRA